MVLLLAVVILNIMHALFDKYGMPIGNFSASNETNGIKQEPSPVPYASNEKQSISEIMAYRSPEGADDMPVIQTMVGNSLVRVTTTTYASGAKITEYADPSSNVVEEIDASGKKRTIISAYAAGA